MKKILTLLFILMLVFTPWANVRAQGEAPQIVDTTIPVDSTIKAHVEAWLGLSAPVALPYWAITYVEPFGLDSHYVSLAALNIANPSDRWRITDDNTVSWMGTVIVRDNGDVEMYADPLATTARVGKNASPIEAPAGGPGGGSYVRFPWKKGSTMMYGPRGVHAAGGGGAYATGFLAVDFVGGDDMGSGVSGPQVYAAVAGEVDYVCADDTTTLVRTYNETSGDYFIYAHIVDNSNLVMEHQFGTGALIGTLKYGSFDDNCGWAEQQDDHYHLHFGFQAQNNAMRMEGCILNTATKKWTCGTQTVSTGQFLKGGGGSGSSGTGGSDSNDGGMSVEQPSFWDYVVVGAVTIWDRTVIRAMPTHTAMQFTNVLYQSVKLGIKLARVMVYSNINLGPLLSVVIFGFGIKLIFGIAEFIVFLFKAWKSLVPVLGA